MSRHRGKNDPRIFKTLACFRIRFFIGNSRKLWVKKVIYIFGGLCLAIIFAILQCHGGVNPTEISFTKAQRIVSLAPGITETLYALGLGDRISGVTEFCNWPKEAALKTKVGAFREINLEAIVRTGADLVIMPQDMEHFKPLIEDIGIPVQLFDLQSLDGFLRDLSELGLRTGSEDQAKKLLAQLNEQLTKDIPSSNSPKVLFALMSPEECLRPITELTIIGQDGFYSELIKAAGGKNAYNGSSPFPRVSLESILAMNPDLILVAAPEAKNLGELKKRWSSITHLSAIHNGHFFILDDPGAIVPGPRAPDTLKKISLGIEAILQDCMSAATDDSNS